MLWTISLASLLLLQSSAVAAQSKTFSPDNDAPHHTAVSPASFTVASVFDRKWAILDVEPVSAADTKVRFIEAYEACGSYRVREEDYVFENVSVAELAGEADLCRSDRNVSAVVGSYRNKKLEEPWFDGRLGTAAQCGTETVIHRLPSRSDLRQPAFMHAEEGVTGLWELEAQITERFSKEAEHEAFEKAYPIETREKNEYLAKHAATQIRNGDFDAILPELPDSMIKDGLSRLSDVMPDADEATSEDIDHGVVENIASLGLEKITPITYPQMARIARIQGDVHVRIRVDEDSGTVIDADVSSGHPILAQAALAAAREWTFSHPYFGANPVEVVIHFEVHCPLIVESSSAVANRDSRKKKRPSKEKHQTVNLLLLIVRW